MLSQPYITLNNGIKIPQLGLGVWQVPDGKAVKDVVSAGIDCGYRLIDTAAAYGNEAGVGVAISQSSVPREEIFVTTKLWNGDQGYDNAIAAFEASIQRLGLEYVDLYLIHWPMPKRDKYVETWRALEELYKRGRTKAIGVSNFTVAHLDRLLTETDIIPAVNQIELHPEFPQEELRQFCSSHNIAVESWSPLGGAKGSLLENESLQTIGIKYGKSPAQIVIRWHIELGLIVIPKSAHAERLQENFDVFDFTLDEDDMKMIDSLNSGVRRGADPEEADFT